MKTQEREKKAGGRPRKATPIRNADGTHSVRVTMEVEGETIRRMVNLGTSDRQVAKARGLRLVRGEAPEVVTKQKESFEEVANELLSRSTIATAKNRLQRLRDYAYPVLGKMRPADIKVTDVRGALDVCADKLGWTGTVRHLKNDISAVLGYLFESDIIAENAALRISFKKKDQALGGRRIVRVTPLRIVLSDEEFEQFIAYGLSEGEGELSELYMLALCARCLGGMRTSDLHAWKWEHIDLTDWRLAVVPRPKTQGNLDEYGESCLEPYELTGEAAQLVPFLAAWWRRHGCPTEGPVFPVRRGKRAGLHKARGSSYAKALRNALWEARVVRPQPGYAQARPEDRRALCAIQAGVAKKRAALDFHSFRRAWVTATLATPGLSAAESARLADHSDQATHWRYQRDDKHRVIPKGVLPTLPQLPGTQPRGVLAVTVAKPSSHSQKSSMLSGASAAIRTRDLRLRRLMGA